MQMNKQYFGKDNQNKYKFYVSTFFRYYLSNKNEQ